MHSRRLFFLPNPSFLCVFYFRLDLNAAKRSPAAVVVAAPAWHGMRLLVGIRRCARTGVCQPSMTMLMQLHVPSPFPLTKSLILGSRAEAGCHSALIPFVLNHANRTRRRPESGALQVPPAPKEILTSMSLQLGLVPVHRACGQVQYFPRATKCMSLWLAGLSPHSFPHVNV